MQIHKSYSVEPKVATKYEVYVYYTDSFQFLCTIHKLTLDSE